MRSFKDSIVILVIVFSSLFLINTGVMYALFGINALKPVEREDRSSSGFSSETSVGREPKSDAAEGGTNAADASSRVQEDASVSSGAAIAADKTGVLSAGSDMYMTAGEVMSLGELGLRDKLAAVSILSKLDGALSDRIYNMASDGVTYAELEEIKTLLIGRLSAGDMETLYGLLDKSRKLYAEKTGR